MIIQKENEALKGISLFFVNNYIGIDLFLKKTKNNFNNIIDFYSRSSRITIKVNYANWDSTLIYFEEKIEEDEYVLLEKVSLKKFIKKGNSFVFNPVPIHLDLLPENRKKELFSQLSQLNDEDFKDSENIDFKNLITVFLKDNLRVKNNDIIRFNSF